ncbi:MAG: hypothetical protein IJ903_08465 [Ruminococcus sp.]|nr:hypothetical protein [Ruminococcus sp.]
MKRIKGVFSVIAALIIALSSFTVFAESTTYKIDELFMSIAIPNDMLAITRDCKETDSFFSKFGLDYEDTMNSFESAGIYLQAIKNDGSLTLTVTMSKDKNSKEIDNYARAEDSEIEDIMNKYLNDRKVYKSGSIVECNNLKYIRLTMSTKDGKKIVQAEQYCTVVNGMNILVTLTGPKGKKLKSSDKEMLADVIKNTYISDNNFLVIYKDAIIYGGVTVFGLLVVVIVLIILLKKLRNPNRKHKHLVHELAHEHRISETTQIPRKRSISSITKPTTSFMKNYEPIGEVENDSEDIEDIIEEASEKTREVEMPFDDIDEISEDSALDFKDDIVEAEKALQPEESTFEVKEKKASAPKKPKREVPLAEKIVSDNTVKVSEPVEDVPIAKPMEFAEKDKEVKEVKEIKEDKPEPEVEAEIVDVVDEEAPEQVNAYFEEVPEEKDMYAYSDVNTAVDEYSAAKAESQMIREERRELLDTIIRILQTIGRGILAVIKTIWMVICYIIIHIGYFCVNLYRAVKKSRAKKKRMKIEEQRRRNVSEQRRRQREAERARQRQNANRSEGDLVKVRSSGERRPVNRTAYPRNGRNQQRPPQNRRPQQRNGRPVNRRPRG